MKTELILLGNKIPDTIPSAEVVYDYTRTNMSNYGSMVSLILHLNDNQVTDETEVVCIVSSYDDVCLFVDDELKTVNDFKTRSAYSTYIKYFKLHVYDNENTVTDYNNFYLHAIEAICKSNNLTLTFLT